jgi:hypothetical protein
LGIVQYHDYRQLYLDYRQSASAKRTPSSALATSLDLRDVPIVGISESGESIDTNTILVIAGRLPSLGFHLLMLLADHGRGSFRK